MKLMCYIYDLFLCCAQQYIRIYDTRKENTVLCSTYILSQLYFFLFYEIIPVQRWERASEGS